LLPQLSGFLGRLLSELGWSLLVTPTVPRGGTALLAASVRPHPSWHQYLLDAA